jgi:hypothetical protein
MALARIQFQQTIRPADDNLLMHDAAPGLDLDPPYQRGHVWTPEQRVALVKTILQGLPFGAIFLNRRDEWDQPIRVVDGKQRIVTIREFLAGGFSIPADWFEIDALQPGAHRCERVLWKHLTPPTQRRFLNRTTFSVYETLLPTEADEADLYLRINFGGVAQSAADEARARKSAVRGSRG